MDTTSHVYQATKWFFGELTIGMMIAGFCMSLVGIFISMLISGLTRDPGSKRTPFEWSWKFFWNDNTKRMVQSIALTTLILFASIRFSQELLGQKFSMFYCLSLGLGLDKIIEKYKEKKQKPL